jgi:hypothetical protein
LVFQAEINRKATRLLIAGSSYQPHAGTRQRGVVQHHKPRRVPRNAVKAALGEWVEHGGGIKIGGVGKDVDHDV